MLQRSAGEGARRGKSEGPPAPGVDGPSRAWSRAWLSLASVLVLVLGVVLWPGSAQARGRRVVPNLQDSWVTPNAVPDPITTIGVTVHVPIVDGVPLASQRQILQWVERANAALRPHGLALELRRTKSIAGYTEVTRRRDRRRLASLAEHDGTIHVFVTESLDPRVPAPRRSVRGLHWRYFGLNPELRQREYVMVTLGAPKTTFAHEVGHLLGLRHSTEVDNIMCSCRRGDDTRFTTEQGAIMLMGAGRFISRQRQAQARKDLQQYRSLDRARRRQ